MFDTGRSGGIAHLCGVSDVEREGLLAQHMLACGNRHHHELVMGCRRRGNDDRVYLAVQGRVDRSEAALDPEVPGTGGRLFPIAPHERNNIEPCGFECTHVQGAPYVRPDDRYFDRFRHRNPIDIRRRSACCEPILVAQELRCQRACCLPLLLSQLTTHEREPITAGGTPKAGLASRNIGELLFDIP